MVKLRLDLLLTARGLAESRAKAQAAIKAGGVMVDGVRVSAPGAMVEEEARIDFAPAHPWVSRGGVKLAHALDAFGIDPAGRVCLDLGASTGGFTEVLLARGAARVVAVDVGAGQLHPQLASDPRVVSLERTDARALTREMIGEAPSLIVADVSFIGLAKALPAALALAAPKADLIALVKPQFEAGPHKQAVLAEGEARAIAAGVIASLDGLCGFRVRAFCDSPIRGGDGNLEIFLHARRG
jgi:23S rRNA (cytidine1920-2'-O)/16S rRNA (cytidine1409-2'-O)-methyltransferase